MKLTHLTYRYKHSFTPTLVDVNLELVRGKVTALIGNNGSGKSTIGNIISGVLLLKDDRAISYSNRQGKIIRGAVFQNPDMQVIFDTPLEDVLFGLKQLNLSETEERERALEALKTVGMLELADERTRDMSLGQKQRVALAGMIAMKPDILVLDEATSMLDMPSRARFLEIVPKIAATSEVLMITNNPADLEIADIIYRVENGVTELVSH